MHIHFKRSESLQDYLDDLNQETKEKDEWGFFVDIEINAHKEKLKIRESKHKKEIHHYHHYYCVNQNQQDEKEENEQEDENQNAWMMSCGNAFVMAGLLLCIIML